MIEIKPHNGRTALWIDGVPKNPAMYWAMDLGRVESAPLWRRATDRSFQHDLDMHLVGVPNRWVRSC